jgi:hypothetical protein
MSYLFQDEAKIKKMLCEKGASSTIVALAGAAKCAIEVQAFMLAGHTIAAAVEGYKKEIQEGIEAVKKADLKCDCDEVELPDHAPEEKHIAVEVRD